ncbi:M24 family metallopeptidase [Enterococcus sp. DIV1298c]|uniref:aminopeptidase P family protein n=1 Tax=Enterococcus sp. DIV1298c TaxID=2815328 RepID=UPI001A91BB3A|nr:aminopeptidase P family protein [Enterococcus sp. DIV1298c]MBO0460830.1 M24 family metallopeptidase [Enterococcus sp. DIV1298c]
MKKENIQLTTLPKPTIFPDVAPVFLTDATITERVNKTIERMRVEAIDLLVIYADKEHGSNFEYFTGFIPRFEEGLLLLDQTGKCTMILGNENLKMNAHARITADLIHYPAFSLPNQPMTNEQDLSAIFTSLNVADNKKIGLVGWKLFTSTLQDNSQIFDVPYFIVEALKQALPKETSLVNGTHVLIGENGSRVTNNANELAHYEYGANLASSCMLRALDAIEPEVKESEIGQLLNAQGQANTVITIAATGRRFEHANLYPTAKPIQLGDPMSLTTGFKGGLSSRTGFVIAEESQLPVEQSDYLDRVAKPYYAAMVSWLEAIQIGMRGSELYELIEAVLPQAQYHWHLNPGHLTADEEWLASPIYSGSNEIVQSGMIFQLDIIPSVAGYTGVSAEECIAVADERLRNELAEQYPDMWERIITRKQYLAEVLHIQLNEELLPLSNTVGYLRPFFLAKEKALCINKTK